MFSIVLPTPPKKSQRFSLIQRPVPARMGGETNPRDPPVSTPMVATVSFQSHDVDPSSCSITAAASIRPMTRREFKRSVMADCCSWCLASHRSRIVSVGLGLVAKKFTYLNNNSKKMHHMSSLPQIQLYRQFNGVQRGAGGALVPGAD